MKSSTLVPTLVLAAFIGSLFLMPIPRFTNIGVALMVLGFAGILYQVLTDKPRKIETQQSVYEWTARTFPKYNSLEGRTVALVEEAIEVALAAGLPPDRIDNILTNTVLKSQGRPSDLIEETGDLLSCVYALAGQQKFNVQDALDEKMLVNRSRPQSYYDAKVANKIEMGMRIEG